MGIDQSKRSGLFSLSAAHKHWSTSETHSSHATAHRRLNEVVGSYEDADVGRGEYLRLLIRHAKGPESLGNPPNRRSQSRPMAGVIVTGLYGPWTKAVIRNVHPQRSSAVHRPRSNMRQVVNAVHEVVRRRAPDHNPLIDLVPPQGRQAHARHYAY